MTGMFTRAMLLALALAAPVGTVAAQAPVAAADAPSLRIAVRNQTAEAEKARGAARIDGAVRPGDVLRYTLTFTNASARAISNVQLSNPLPAGLAFVAGSMQASRPDAVAEYSADGGKTFSARPTETVTVNGQVVSRAVPADRYTNVRWVVRGAVRARAIVTAEYDARVGAASAASTSPSPAPSGR